MNKRYPAVILATAVVPWDKDDRFQEDLFRREVRMIRDQLTRHIYVFGTAGEGYAVSDRQFEDIVRVFCEETLPHDACPMVGVISLSTATIVGRIQWCRELGIRDFQISLPAWEALTDPEIDIFFDTICQRFPDCQFLHYNLKRARRVLCGEDYARLAARHSNLVAAKVGRMDDVRQLTELVSHAPEMQFFFTEQGYAAMRDHAECGYLISKGLVHFESARQFFAARDEELAALANELQQVLWAVKETVGSQGHIDGAYDKLFVKVHLPEFPLRLLPPYTAADDSCLATFLSRLPARWRKTP